MKIENNLLLSVRNMDKEALAEIFDQYASPLYRYAYRFCSDPQLADQIVGDVFAKFLEQLAKGKGPLNNLRSYLFEITYNSIIDEIRYVSHQASIELVDSYPYGKFSVNPDIEKKLELEKVSQAVQSLSPTQQHVIVLRFLEGFSIGETASILGKTISWVKVMQFRAIRNLRTTLGMGPSVSLSSPKLELTLDPSLNHVS